MIIQFIPKQKRRKLNHIRQDSFSISLISFISCIFSPRISTGLLVAFIYIPLYHFLSLKKTIETFLTLWGRLILMGIILNSAVKNSGLYTKAPIPNRISPHSLLRAFSVSRLFLPKLHTSFIFHFS